MIDRFIDQTAIYVIISSLDWRSLVMIAIGCLFIGLAVVKKYEPLLLLPIGFGIIAGNIPLASTLLADEHSVINLLYGVGIRHELFPPLIFLGIGAMTDFSFLISNPRLILLGAAAQAGIFFTFICGLALGLTAKESGAVGIIGGADGPTAIFLTGKLAPELLAPVAISAYSYMALVPIIQPPIIRLLTTKKERMIEMDPPRQVSRSERILFPIIAFLVCVMIVPPAAILLGMLFFGNLLRESGVTDRLADTAKTSFIDIVTILLGLCVGASARADIFLTWKAISIFVLGITAFAIATACGVLLAKLMNKISKRPINPIIGAAGVSAVPMSARVCNIVGQEENPGNFLLMHAMAPNVAGVIGSAVAAGILLAMVG